MKTHPVTGFPFSWPAPSPQANKHGSAQETGWPTVPTDEILGVKKGRICDVCYWDRKLDMSRSVRCEISFCWLEEASMRCDDDEDKDENEDDDEDEHEDDDEDENDDDDDDDYHND